MGTFILLPTMKNSLILLCLVILAGGIATGGWILSRPNPATPEIARLEKELKDANAQIERLKEALDKMKTTVAKSALPAASAGQPAAGAPGKEGLAPAGEGEKNFLSKMFGSKGGGSALKDMMKMPGMKEMMKQQSLAQMEMQYGGLFKLFKLNPEERENLKQLLAARGSAEMDMGLKFMDEKLTPEQRKQITADYETAKKANDEAIHTFLGDEGDYKTFKHWEETKPERVQMEMMGGRGQFESVGEPLTPEQEQKLIDVMAAVRKAPSKVPDLSKPENLSPENMTDEALRRLMEKTAHDAQTVSQNAAGFLSARQLEALGKMQEQQRTMTEAGLKMSRAMFNGGK